MKTRLQLTSILLAAVAVTSAQPRFEIPLAVTDGVQTEVLGFGILPNGHTCIDSRDSINGHIEMFLLRPDPWGVFGARLLDPQDEGWYWRYGCFEEGAWYDFRPFTSTAQRDTFRACAQPGSLGIRMMASWPGNLSTRFERLILTHMLTNGTFDTVDMLVETSVDLGPGNRICWFTIYSAGPRGTTDVSITDHTLPSIAFLDQNYPNPFNPSTRIGFRLPAGQAGIADCGWVKLTVYDVLGCEVATLVNEQLTPGRYERTFNAEGLSSGVYFYRLTSPYATTTRKMLLMH